MGQGDLAQLMTQLDPGNTGNSQGDGGSKEAAAGPGARVACDEDDDDGCLMLDDEEWSDTELYVLQHAGKMVESALAVLHGTL